MLKRLFGQLLTQNLIYLARANRYWAQLTLQTQHMRNKTSVTISYIKKEQNKVENLPGFFSKFIFWQWLLVVAVISNNIGMTERRHFAHLLHFLSYAMNEIVLKLCFSYSCS